MMWLSILVHIWGQIGRWIIRWKSVQKESLKFMDMKCFVLFCSVFVLFFFYLFSLQEAFVCLTGCSVRWHTWVLMGPDSNKKLKPDYKSMYKHAGWVVFENKESRNRFEVKKWRKRRPLPLPTNQVEQFFCQPLGQEKGGSLSNLNCHGGLKCFHVMKVSYFHMKYFLLSVNPESSDLCSCTFCPTVTDIYIKSTPFAVFQLLSYTCR